MEKERVQHDLALIYTEVMFQDHILMLPASEKEDPRALADQLFFFYEEARNALAQREAAEFDF